MFIQEGCIFLSFVWKHSLNESSKHVCQFLFWTIYLQKFYKHHIRFICISILLWHLVARKHPRIILQKSYYTADDRVKAEIFLHGLWSILMELDMILSWQSVWWATWNLYFSSLLLPSVGKIITSASSPVICFVSNTPVNWRLCNLIYTENCTYLGRLYSL